MELQFNPKGINENHERYREGERKKIAKVKKKEQYELEAKYRARRIMVGVLGTAAIAGLILTGKVIDDKLTDKVYQTYGQSTGVMRHPETHELQKYWTIEENGKEKNYFMSQLKWKVMFAKQEKGKEVTTNYTPGENSLLGETKPLK